jgi:hypothetical protein
MSLAGLVAMGEMRNVYKIGGWKTQRADTVGIS